MNSVIDTDSVDGKENGLKSLTKIVHENNYTAAQAIYFMYNKSGLNSDSDSFYIDKEGSFNVPNAFVLSLIISHIKFRFDKYLLQKDPNETQTYLLPEDFFS